MNSEKFKANALVYPTNRGINEGKIDSDVQGTCLGLGIDDRWVRVVIGDRKTAQFYPVEFWDTKRWSA